MNWFKIAKQDNEKEIVQAIRETLHNHLFLRKLREDYNIPEEDIDENLDIKFVDLDDRFAEGNSEEIKLDKSLLGDNFFDQYFHFVVHEFYHWIKRRVENRFYFNDPEEIESFILAIAWELMNGNSKDNIDEKIFPIIESHFKDKKRAKKLYHAMLVKAKKMARHKLHNK